MVIKWDSLIDLLPEYFRDNDSYKDKNNKGLLERFLEVIGWQISENHNNPEENEIGLSIIPDITNIVDNIDVMTTRDDLLDYIFSWIGYPPQEWLSSSYELNLLHSPPISVWYLDPQIPLINRTLLGWKEADKYISSKIYTETDRYLIRYAKSLYAIRGTKKFYEVLLGPSFYNLDFEIEEETDYRCNGIGTLYINVGDTDLTNIEKRRLVTILNKYTPINVNLEVTFPNDNNTYYGEDNVDIT